MLLSSRETATRKRKLATQTVAEAATNELRKRIMAGEFPDGSPLRQDALAEELGVSRNPIREALTKLESEGLVENKPYCGYLVTALSTEDIEEIFELRMLLEPELIRQAIPRMTEADLDKADTILTEFKATLDNSDFRHWGELNVSFHMALYDPSDRRRALDFVRGLLINMDRYTKVLLTLGQGSEDAKDDHSGLLELCRKRSVEQAVALTRDHIKRVHRNLRTTIGATVD